MAINNFTFNPMNASLPQTYDDDLSLYEKLCFVVTKLKECIDEYNAFETATNTAVANFETATNNTINSYIILYNELKDYVDDFFTGLNIQNEINIKINDLVADGTIESIINHNIFNKLISHNDTVSAMKSNSNLKAGDYCVTKGYYAVNDGGGACYIIVNATSDKYYETLNSGLFAELVADIMPNVKQFGASGSETNAVETTNAFKTAFDKYKNIYIPHGTYLINESLLLNKSIRITMDEKTVIKANAGMSTVFKLSIDGNYEDVNSILGLKKYNLIGGIIDCNNLAQIGIYSYSCYNSRIDGVTVKNFIDTGIKITHEANNGGNYIKNCLVWGKNGSANFGIQDTGYDNYLENCTVVNCKTGIETLSDKVTNCNVWNDELALYDGSVGFLNMSHSSYVNCTADTVQYAWELGENVTTFMNNCYVINNDGVILPTSTTCVFKPRATNSRVYYENLIVLLNNAFTFKSDTCEINGLGFKDAFGTGTGIPTIDVIVKPIINRQYRVYMQDSNKLSFKISGNPFRQPIRIIIGSGIRDVNGEIIFTADSYTGVPTTDIIVNGNFGVTVEYSTTNSITTYTFTFADSGLWSDVYIEAPFNTNVVVDNVANIVGGTLCNIVNLYTTRAIDNITSTTINNFKNTTNQIAYFDANSAGNINSGWGLLEVRRVVLDATNDIINQRATIQGLVGKSRLSVNSGRTWSDWT